MLIQTTVIAQYRANQYEKARRRLGSNWRTNLQYDVKEQNWNVQTETRRASTVGITTDGSRDDNIPYTDRSKKSVSVDHGFAAPFDFGSFRSKVEGRFDSADKLNKDGDSVSKENLSVKMQKSAPPVKTISYRVEPSDTLSSVAARFDTTPSELAILNRLPSRTVFPGQTIRVPEKRKKKRVSQDGSSGNEDGDDAEDDSENGGLDSESQLESDGGSVNRRLSANECESTEECELLESLRPASPKPGHVERVRAPLGASYANRPRFVAPQERFLKIHVRHITDGQGVVPGVLLVTPNAVMFDPNVSDALVLEHGAESYGVIAPMEFVVNAAIYHDIAHMRVAHMEQKHDPNIKHEIYYLKHRDSISAEGGAKLYRSQAEEEEKEKKKKEEEQEEEKKEGGEENTKVSSESAEEEQSESTNLVSHVSVSSEDAPTVCSCDLVTSTPPNTTSSSTCEEPQLVIEAEAVIRRLEERRQSSLDHHWAVPKASLDETSTPATQQVVDAEALIQRLEERRQSSLDHHWAVPKTSLVVENNDESNQEVNEEKDMEEDSSSLGSSSHLIKQSCHDSGIDIRDPLPTPVVKKSTYSDADILLADSNEFIPPIPVIPVHQQQDERKKQHNSVSFNVNEDENKENSGGDTASTVASAADKQESKKNKMKKRLSYPLSWMEGFSSDKDDKESLPSSGDSSQPASSHSHSSSMLSRVFSRRPSVGTFIRQQHGHSPHRSESTSSGSGSGSATIPLPKLNYHSEVSVEDMPELFGPLDKLIPRPARSCDDPPLYLRLRMGLPKNKRVPKSTPIMSYGKKKMRPEYWFSVPRNRVDELYKFLMLWVPHLYGDLDEDKVSERGYELVDSDTELWDDESTSPERRNSDGGENETTAADIGRESWEALPISEELRRALYASSSIDLELFLPDLNGVTEILTEDHRKQLCRHLPARAEGYVWTLVFSTSQHGFSLNSMYRKMTRIDSPILLVIQDTDCNVFGALTSCALKVSDHFYGTGESLLFSFTPELQVYNWTGDNMYFLKGNNESLSIGAGDGKFGLWLDGDLYQGRSEPCSTYGNEPLSPQQDFVVKTLECWAFT